VQGIIVLPILVVHYEVAELWRRHSCCEQHVKQDWKGAILVPSTLHCHMRSLRNTFVWRRSGLKSNCSCRFLLTCNLTFYRNSSNGFGVETFGLTHFMHFMQSKCYNLHRRQAQSFFAALFES
jgi:hypothetical protein